MSASKPGAQVRGVISAVGCIALLGAVFGGAPAVAADRVVLGENFTATT